MIRRVAIAILVTAILAPTLAYGDDSTADDSLPERCHDLIDLKTLEPAMEPRSPDAFFRVGGCYHTIAAYPEAASYYEALVQRFPNHPRAEEALVNAATFHHGLGEYERALKNYRQYVELFADNPPERTTQVVLLTGEVLEELGDHDEAIAVYEELLDHSADTTPPDIRLQARLRIGLYHWRRDGEEDRREAVETFEKVVDEYRSLDRNERLGLSPFGTDAAARAQFMIAENLMRNLDDFEIDAFESDSTKDDADLIAEQTEKKSAMAEDTRRAYESVIEMHRPDWAIAAYFRIGEAFDDLADSLRNEFGPLPETPQRSPNGRPSNDSDEVLMEHVAETIDGFEMMAAELYEAALAVTRDHHRHNEYTERVAENLARIHPEKYRGIDEIIAPPTHDSDGLMSSEFITEHEVP